MAHKMMGEMPTNKCRRNERGIRKSSNHIAITDSDKNHSWVPKSCCDYFLGYHTLPKYCVTVWFSLKGKMLFTGEDPDKS